MMQMIKQFHAILEQKDFTIQQWCEMYECDLSAVIAELYACKLSDRVIEKINEFVEPLK